MYLVLLEDDHLQAETIIATLRQAFALRESDIKWIKTESDFRNQLRSIIDLRPRAVILDVMVRWCDPGRNMPARPENVKEDGHFIAGIRCQQELARQLAEDKLPPIPVIVYTVVDEQEVMEKFSKRGSTEGVTIMGKGTDMGPLLQRIRAIPSGERT